MRRHQRRAARCPPASAPATSASAAARAWPDRRIVPAALVSATGSPSATPSTPASWLSMNTASRAAPVSGSVVGEHHRVELLAAARRHVPLVGAERQSAPRRARRSGPGRPAVGNSPPGAQVAAAVLHGVADLLELLDAGVQSARASAISVAQRAVVAPTRTGRARSGRTRDGELGEDLPLAAGLARAGPATCGAEHDLALGRRARAAALLLVARRRRQQDHVVALDEHLGRQDDVLVHAQRHTCERAPRPAAGRAAPRGGWPPSTNSTSRSPRSAASTISGAVSPTSLGHGEAPAARASTAACSASTGSPPGKRGGVGAHLGAALHARVAADRHQPGAVAADVAAGQADVDDRAHAVDAVGVLGDAHGPDEHGAVARRRRGRRTAPASRRRRRRRSSSVARSSARRRAATSSSQPVGVGGDPARGRRRRARSARCSTALTNATSPSGRTGTWRSHSFVPNSADSTLDGTQ